MTEFKYVMFHCKMKMGATTPVILFGLVWLVWFGMIWFGRFLEVNASLVVALSITPSFVCLSHFFRCDKALYIFLIFQSQHVPQLSLLVIMFSSCHKLSKVVTSCLKKLQVSQVFTSCHNLSQFVIICYKLSLVVTSCQKLLKIVKCYQRLSLVIKSCNKSLEVVTILQKSSKVMTRCHKSTQIVTSCQMLTKVFKCQ